LSTPKALLRIPVSCKEESSSKPAYLDRAHAAERVSVAVTSNIAFRPRSGDLILMNTGLAKPIP
jgi:hypothetical protein